MKIYIPLLLCLIFPTNMLAQNDVNVPFVDMRRIETKNYFFTALINQLPEYRELVSIDTNLINIHRTKLHKLNEAKSIEQFMTSLQFSEEEIQVVDVSLTRLFREKPQSALKLRYLLDQSYFYGVDKKMNDETALLYAWHQDAKGMNKVIDIYGLGKAPAYPLIDSISFDVNSNEYKHIMLSECKQLIVKIEEQSSLFFSISLSAVHILLDINERLQCEDFEPILKTQNRASHERIKMIDWDKYDYTFILVLGAGPEIQGQRISTIGRLRASYGALLYKEGKAPFIMLSGGRVHPYRTSFCEAEEMKKYLMDQWGIPEAAIILDPWARHTTTNLRNAARLVYRMGIPSERPALVTSSEKHIDDVCSKAFQERCMREINIIPFKEMKRILGRTASFLPVKECFLANPSEPMDP